MEQTELASHLCFRWSLTSWSSLTSWLKGVCPCITCREGLQPAKSRLLNGKLIMENIQILRFKHCISFRYEQQLARERVGKRAAFNNLTELVGKIFGDLLPWRKWLSISNFTSWCCACGRTGLGMRTMVWWCWWAQAFDVAECICVWLWYIYLYYGTHDIKSGFGNS
jgi:hypothetical protein